MCRYLDEEVISQISSQFEEDSFVELKDFLVADELKAIVMIKRVWKLKCVLVQKHVKYLFQLDNSTDKENKRTSYTEGVSNGWHLAGPSNCRRYLTLKAEEKKGADESAKLLMDLKTKLFASDAFAKLVSAFTG